MMSIQDINHFICGREREVNSLKSILNKVLQCNGSNSVHGTRRCTKDDIGTRYNEMLLPQNMKRKLSVDSLSVTKTQQSLCSTLTDEELSTSVSVDDLYEAPPQVIASEGVCHIPVDHDDDRCQLVLVQGPAGSGKSMLIHAAIDRFHQMLNHTIDDESYNKSISPQSSHMYEDIERQRAFLLVEGSCCRYSSTIANQRSNLVGKEVPLKAFDDVVRDIYYSICEGNNQRIRTQFISQLANPVGDVEVFTDAYPFLKSWLQTDISTNASCSINRSNDNKLSLDISWNTPCTLRQELFIVQEAQQLSTLIQHFIKAVSYCIPIVLFVKNIQYADRLSIVILENLLKDVEMLQVSNGLLIICSWEPDDRVIQTNAFASFLQRCKQIKTFPQESNYSKGKDLLINSHQNEVTDSQQHSITFHNICIQHYSSDDVYELVQQSSGHFKECSTDDITSLAQSVFNATNGKPLPIHFLLVYLECNKAPIRGENIEQICNSTDLSVVLNSIILRQDIPVQDVLKTLAALSYYCESDDAISRNVLQLLLGQSCTAPIKVAVNVGLLQYCSSNQYIMFSLKELQAAAYNLIPKEDLPAFHVTIGRTLWSFTATSKLATNHIILAVSHLSNHLDHIADVDECYKMSKAAYQSGKESAILGDFSTAAKLFDFAIRVLGTRVWKGDLYETSLVLHNSLAQAYCCTGEDDQVQRALNDIFDNAVSFDDSIPASITLTYFQGSRGNYLLSFHTACNALKLLGESVNPNPSNLSVVLSFVKTKRLLEKKSEDELVNLQHAENEKNIAIAILYLHTSIFSYMVNANIGTMIIFRMLQLSIKWGVSGPSAIAFAFYGFVLCVSGNMEEGRLMCRVALKLADKFQEFKPRVDFIVYYATWHWTNPLRDCSQSLFRTLPSALKHGDVEQFTISANAYVLLSFLSGTSLVSLEPISRSIFESIHQLQHTTALLSAIPMWSLITNLSCNNQNLNAEAAFNDIDSALKYAVKEKVMLALGHIYVIRCIWHYLLGNYIEAFISAKNCSKHRKVLDYMLIFYEGLAVLAASRTSARRKYSRHGKAMVKKMKIFANLCPTNFLNKQYLMEAEIASLNGNNTLAEQLYQQSIDKSKEEGFIHEAGIAFERWGYHHLYLRGKGVSKLGCITYFNHARAAYEQWGATLLVRRIDRILSNECK